MKHRARLVIIILVFVLFTAGVVAYSILSERVALPEEGTVGNTPGNMINGGYFCELNDRVYFSNPEDSHTLYSMKPDETDFKRLGSMGVSMLTGSGKYIYMFMDAAQYSSGKGLGYMGNTYGIFRHRIRDGKNISLEKGRPDSLQLCGSYVYFSGIAEDGAGTYKVRVDKKDRVKISDVGIQTAGFDGRYLFFPGANGDPSLYYLNTPLGDVESKVLDGNISSPIPIGDFVYYIDNTKDYHICRYNRTTRAAEEICTERVDCFNTNGSFIWYAVSVSDRPALKRMNMTGQDISLVAEGVYNSINLTSRYVYFAPFDKKGVNSFLHAPVDSFAMATRFEPLMPE